MGVITQESQAALGSRGRSRNVLNFWIDLVTALAFTVLLGTSFIMKFILPPGTCDEVGQVKVWLGHSRHWWGDIHFWTAVLMLALIVVHIWLHWSWVRGLWGRLLGRYYAPRSAATLLLMAGALAVPFIVPYQYMPVESAEQPAAAVNADAGQGAETVPAGIAPCGVEGLSCDTCPAADDRLFGSGCGEEEAAEDAEAHGDEFILLGPEPEDTEDDVQESGCGDGSACATCPNAESCGEDKESTN